MTDNIARLDAFRRGGGTSPPADAATEHALADNFAAENAGAVRYVATWGKWLVWAGTHWQPDRTRDVPERVRRFMAAASNDESVSPKDRRRLCSARAIGSVESLARGDRRLALSPEDFDADPWILATPGGIVDLRTGEVRAATPDDRVSKCAGVAPAPAGTPCPLWRRFIDDITGQDDVLDQYLQRVFGYALTGDTSEECLWFLFGHGANGKSVFLRVLSDTAGDYAQAASPDLFLDAAPGRHPTELADLRGARVVTASEVDPGRRWAESRVKQMTGRDRVRARFVRQDAFEFLPQCKLFLAGNRRPALRGTDTAWRRRLHMISLDRTVPAERRDPELAERIIREEGGAVLRWAIDGAVAWRARRLDPPAAVTEATRAYFCEADTVQRWIDDCCAMGGGWSERKSLFASWRSWCDQVGERPGRERDLYASLESRGDIQPSTRRGRRGFAGISVGGASQGAPG